MKTVFLPTVQHTGTWFMIHFLMSHSQVRHLFHEERKWRGNFPDGSLVQTHIGEGGVKHPNDAPKFMPAGSVAKVLENQGGVSCVRDPLLSLISRQLRHPTLSHDYIIDGFVRLADWWGNGWVHILPIDLLGEKRSLYAGRVGGLKALLSYLDLPIEPYVWRWAINWPVRNTVGVDASAGLIQSYQDGDLYELEQHIGAGLEMLRARQWELRPLFEGLGYRNLLWWTEEKKEEMILEDGNIEPVITSEELIDESSNP